MDLLPLVFVKGLAAPTSPAMARFLVNSAGAELGTHQKRDGESDLEFLARMDAIYAGFKG